MPSTRIETRRSRTDDEVEALIEAVYLAQREALLVPEGDRQIRYVEHPAGRFAVPPGRSDDFALVEVTLFPGRSAAAKKRLFEGITRRFGELGIAPDDVLIIVHEPPLENWSLGGRPASEVELGFDLDV